MKHSYEKHDDNLVLVVNYEPGDKHWERIREAYIENISNPLNRSSRSEDPLVDSVADNLMAEGLSGRNGPKAHADYVTFLIDLGHPGGSTPQRRPRHR